MGFQSEVCLWGSLALSLLLRMQALEAEQGPVFATEGVTGQRQVTLRTEKKMSL